MTRMQDALVDMYEQLPVPFGLVRFGVAPDHPEVKVNPVEFWFNIGLTPYRIVKIDLLKWQLHLDSTSLEM